MPTWPADPVALPDCQLNWEALKKLFTVVESISTTVQGPGAVGTPVVYNTVEVNLSTGTWLVYGQATMSSQTAADAKKLNFYNQTLGATIANASSPVVDAGAINVNQLFSTIAVLKFNSETKVRLQGQQNGGSQITFGTALAAGAIQRLTAVRLQ